MSLLLLSRALQSSCPPPLPPHSPPLPSSSSSPSSPALLLPLALFIGDMTGSRDFLSPLNLARNLNGL